MASPLWVLWGPNRRDEWAQDDQSNWFTRSITWDPLAPSWANWSKKTRWIPSDPPPANVKQDLHHLARIPKQASP